MTPDYRLYHMPGSCSRIAINALEEIGLPYSDKGVALLRGAQHEPWFRLINAKGKVPVLIADRETVTELPAILYRLAAEHPESGLLPIGDDGRPKLTALSDVIWMSGALHPIVNRIFRPTGISTLDAAGVKAAALAQLAEHASAISGRLDAQIWWYSERWSIADTFLVWIFSLAAEFGFGLENYPPLMTLRREVEARPGFARAAARERTAVTRDDLPLPPGTVL